MKKQRDFDESELIALVKTRPVIYDRKSKDYRRPGITENAWLYIAQKLNVSKVEDVKKRWKSLRDAFIKYYRQDIVNGKPFGNKKKKWIYYESMSYLSSHVELFGLDNIVQPPNLHEEAKGENVLEDDQGNSHLIDDNIDNMSLEYDDNSETIEIIDDAEKIQKLLNDHQKKQELIEKSRHEEFTRPLESDAAISVVVIDPDERYLLSCLPVLKRISHQKNALLKMKIQQLLYEVEFETNDEEPVAQRKRCY